MRSSTQDVDFVMIMNLGSPLVDSFVLEELALEEESLLYCLGESHIQEASE